MDELFEGTLFSYDEPEDQEAELRGLMAYSGSGKLYVACDDGSIKAADVRQQLLSGAWAERGTKADGAPPLRLRTLTASPPLELTAAHFALNRSGTYAAVAGSALEDPEISRVVVVDLTNCRLRRQHPPARRAAGRAAGGRGGAAPTGAHAVHDVCEAVVLDAELFASRPGLRVLQIEWHPDSDSHLAVLTSDNVWRLYNTQRADLAEQTFELQLRGRRGLGLGGGGSSSNGRAVAAFAFGPPEGWQRFAVYFLTADGELWSLCPVVPFGCRYAASLIDQVAESSSASLDAAANAEAWLQRAFTQLSTPQDPAFASGMVQSVPHALDEHVPALVGPLQVATGGGGQQRLTQLAGGADVAQALLLSRFGEGCTAVAAATARGYVGLHLLTGEAAPAWYEAAPQCVLEGLEIEAVRSQVGVMPASPGQPARLLLDVVNLSLPQDAAAAAAAAAADPEEGEIGGGGGSGAAAATIALAQDAAAPEVLYAVHSSGAHAIKLTWLPLLAGLLAEDSRAPPQLPAALPQPSAELLLHSTAGVVAAAPVGDSLSGSALVVLEASGKAQCLRPHRAARSADEAPTAAAAGTAGAPASAAAGASSAAQRDVEAQIATIYGDLRKGSKACVLPQAAAGRPTGAGNPEGQRMLNEAAAALRGSHVEFAHQAHQDLMELHGELDKQRQRAEAAEAMASAADQAAAALDVKAERVQRFQENLSERLRLLAELHWSLPRPPSRAEQRFAQEQLPAFEAAAAALQDDARALRARVSTLQRKLRSMGEVAAGAAAVAAGGAAVPPHQLRRVREALAEQEQQIGSNQQRLAVLEEAAAAAAALRG